MEDSSGIDLESYLRGRVWLFGLLGSLMGLLLAARPPSNPVDLGILAIITGLLWLGCGASVYYLVRGGSETQTALEPGGYVCRHCARTYASQRAWTAHQRTCPEMKL